MTGSGVSHAPAMVVTKNLSKICEHLPPSEYVWHVYDCELSRSVLSTLIAMDGGVEPVEGRLGYVETTESFEEYIREKYGRELSGTGLKRFDAPPEPVKEDSWSGTETRDEKTTAQITIAGETVPTDDTRVAAYRRCKERRERARKAAEARHSSLEDSVTDDQLSLDDVLEGESEEEEESSRRGCAFRIPA